MIEDLKLRYNEQPTFNKINTAIRRTSIRRDRKSTLYASLNEGLFKRIKSVYEQRNNLNLNQEELRLLEKTYESFARNGANLSPEDVFFSNDKVSVEIQLKL